MLSNEFKVIKAFLKRPFDKLYGREIERLADITHSRSIEYLKSLVQQNVLYSEKRGNQVLYSINPNSELSVKAVSITEFERKQDFFENKLVEKSILQRLVSAALDQCPNAIHFTLLFGSVARTHARTSSDIDVLFVISNNKNTKKDLEKIGKELVASTGRKISIHTVTIKEIEKLWLVEPVYKGIWNDRIVLYGEEQFWRFVLKVGGHL